jgi:hypothetical protein
MRTNPFVARVSLALMGVGALLVSCAPAPRYVSCSNGGECAEKDSRYAYCLEGRCVECVANGGCGENRLCENGQCVVNTSAPSARTSSTSAE